MKLWNNQTEIKFFTEALKSFATPEQLFYNLSGNYYAYVPRGLDAQGQTLQSRNSLIGQYTEKWCRDLFNDIARQLNLFAVNGVICETLGLTRQSNADLAFCTNENIEQRAENIKLLFEIKMSIVSNYSFTKPDMIKLIGDFTQHKGTPSILRSDSMLKAIGKSINIRVSGNDSNRIPIIVLGNTPITESYQKKVDFLKQSGVIQGFWSLNPSLLNSAILKNTLGLGFETIIDETQLFNNCKNIIESDFNYFSAMISKKELGEIIKIASQETCDVAKADKFITLISGSI